MTEFNWSKVRNKIANSIFQIDGIIKNYNPLKPYENPTEEKSAGTGFLIDAGRGLVMTNAHVVGNCDNIWGYSLKTGKKRLFMELVSIIHNKDLAIVKITDKHLKNYLKGESDIKSLEIKFEDSFNVKTADNVIIVGYHMGKMEAIYSPGIVSSFFSDDNGFNIKYSEDSYSRDTTYISTSSVIINKGISGSPLINTNGNAIGVNSAGILGISPIAYTIPSRIVLTVLPEMFKKLTPIIPTFSLDWSPTTESTRIFITGDKKKHGIMVRDIEKDSVLKGLYHKDIISDIRFSIPMKSNNVFSFCDIVEKKHDYKELLASFDSDGDIKLYDYDMMKSIENKKKEYLFTERILPINELSDIIPINQDFTTYIYRDKERLQLTMTNEHLKTSRCYHIYPNIHKFKYNIVAGFVITNLMFNQLDLLPIKVLKANEFFYKDHLIITHVFPKTSGFKNRSISPGDLIKEINGIPTNNLMELSTNFKKLVDGYLTILTENDSFMAVTAAELLEDEKIIKSDLK